MSAPPSSFSDSPPAPMPPSSAPPGAPVPPPLTDPNSMAQIMAMLNSISNRLEAVEGNQAQTAANSGNTHGPNTDTVNNTANLPGPGAVMSLNGNSLGFTDAFPVLSDNSDYTPSRNSVLNIATTVQMLDFNFKKGKLFKELNLNKLEQAQFLDQWRNVPKWVPRPADPKAPSELNSMKARSLATYFSWKLAVHKWCSQLNQQYEVDTTELVGKIETGSFTDITEASDLVLQTKSPNVQLLIINLDKRFYVNLADQKSTLMDTLMTQPRVSGTEVREFVSSYQLIWQHASSLGLVLDASLVGTRLLTLVGVNPTASEVIRTTSVTDMSFHEVKGKLLKSCPLETRVWKDDKIVNQKAVFNVRDKPKRERAAPGSVDKPCKNGSNCKFFMGKSGCIFKHTEEEVKTMKAKQTEGGQ